MTHRGAALRARPLGSPAAGPPRARPPARMPHPARIADDHDVGNHLIHIYMFLEQRQRTISDYNVKTLSSELLH